MLNQNAAQRSQAFNSSIYIGRYNSWHKKEYKVIQRMNKAVIYTSIISNHQLNLVKDRIEVMTLFFEIIIMKCFQNVCLALGVI